MPDLRFPSYLIRACTLALVAASSAVALAQGDRGPYRGNYDVRVFGRTDLVRLGAAAAAPDRPVADAMPRAIADFRNRGGEVSVSPLSGSAEVVRNPGGALTPPAPGRDGRDIALDFVADHADLYGLSPADARALRFLGESTSARSGLRMVRLEQAVRDLPVFQGELRVLLDERGSVVRTVGRLVPAIATAAVGTTPVISAAEALVRGMATVGVALDAGRVDAGAATFDGTRFRMTTGEDPVLGPVDARGVLFPLNPGVAVPAWSLVVFTAEDADWYLVVSADDGTLLYRKNIRQHASTEEARFSVYVQADGRTPADSPAPQSPSVAAVGAGTQFPALGRTLVAMSAAQDLGASPDGWIPDGGVTTTGNNVDAYLDTDADNAPDAALLDAAGRPQGNPDAATRDRDFLGAAPRDFGYAPAPTLGGDPDAGDAPGLDAFRRGAVTQLFYTANWYHDELFALGFDEAAGNFQSANASGMGAGGDPVLAEAQDGSGTSNANFTTPPDGSSGRMQMFLFTFPTPDRDGSLDSDIVVHELTHGLSNRLVGDAAGLNWFQGAGMGEGWSDFYALALLNGTNADDPDGSYASGAYATYQLAGLSDNYVYGIRRFPYSTDNGVNPLTWADTDDTRVDLSGGIAASPLGLESGGANEVHNAGELWALSLWEVRSRIIAANGGDVPAGNGITLQLVTDALKMTPLDPTFVEARDALFDADCATNACANEEAIWGGFADRGLGYGAASSSGVSTHYGIRESFAVPYLTAGGFTVSEQNAPLNGVLDPGEEALVAIELENPWRAAGKAVASASAQIVGASPGIQVLGDSATYGAIAPQGSAAGTPFLIAVDDAAACGGSQYVDVEVTSSLGTTVTRLDLRVGKAGGPGTPIVYTRNAGGLTIPQFDLTGVVDTLSIADDLEIADLDLRIDDLAHDWVGDLTVELRGPNGYGTDVIFQLAGTCFGPLILGFNCGQNFVATVIDDESANDLLIVGETAAPFTGDWFPNLNSPAFFASDPVGQLSHFDGSGTAGDWQLFLSDVFPIDGGTLNAWSLLVTPVDYVCNAPPDQIFVDGFESGDTTAWSKTVL